MEGSKSKFRVLLERIDWPLMVIVSLLAGIGIINLYSAARATGGFSLHVTQTIWFLGGLFVIGLMTLVDYRVIERWAYIIFGVVVLMLAAVLVVGTELNGSKRWLNFGFFMMQPSELLKLAVIIIAARYFQDHPNPHGYRLRDLVKPFALVGGAVFFVLIQPDLGTSLVILAIFMTMVLFEGVRWQSIATLALVAVVSAPLVWSFGMKEYQQDRVISFLNLEEDTHGKSWQVRQSMIAFGSGRVWGKGHVEGTQVQKGFVPEHENDFIAANWGEEHGFAGMVVMLSLFMALILWSLRISRRARDRFGAHVGVGVAALIFWHVVVNLGMVTGLLPVVGLTLPLLSYGGSSLMTVLLAIGLLLNVSVRRRPLTA
jgi:rod shape determining protein RodA